MIEPISRYLAPYSKRILGVRFDSIDSGTALDIMSNFVRERNGHGAKSVFFSNVHTIHLARRNKQFRDTINGADLVLPDGSGLGIAGRVFRTPVRENLNGTDLTPSILKVAEREGWTVYLLGSERAVVAKCVARLRAIYPALDIVGYREGFLHAVLANHVIEEINQKKPDILLVGLGSPRQEAWIAKNAHELAVGMALGVGGLFDFLAGRFRRAPYWMRHLGIEWVYRFFQDPRTKWRRIFIEIPEFLVLVLAAALVPRRRLRSQRKNDMRRLCSDPESWKKRRETAVVRMAGLGRAIKR